MADKNNNSVIKAEKYSSDLIKRAKQDLEKLQKYQLNWKRKPTFTMASTTYRRNVAIEKLEAAIASCEKDSVDDELYYFYKYLSSFVGKALFFHIGSWIKPKYDEDNYVKVLNDTLIMINNKAIGYKLRKKQLAKFSKLVPKQYMENPEVYINSLKKLNTKLDKNYTMLANNYTMLVNNYNSLVKKNNDLAEHTKATYQVIDRMKQSALLLAQLIEDTSKRTTASNLIESDYSAQRNKRINIKEYFEEEKLLDQNKVEDKKEFNIAPDVPSETEDEKEEEDFNTNLDTLEETIDESDAEQEKDIDPSFDISPNSESSVEANNQTPTIEMPPLQTNTIQGAKLLENIDEVVTSQELTPSLLLKSNLLKMSDSPEVSGGLGFLSEGEEDKQSSQTDSSLIVVEKETIPKEEKGNKPVSP